MRPLARTAALNGYVELSRSLGLDPRALMKGVGLDTADLAVQDRWISGTAVVRLLELSAAACGREDFGLLLTERRRFSNLGPISLLVREEPDVRSALALLIRHQHTYNEVLHARLSEGNGVATLKVDLRLGEPQPARQGTELAVGAFHRVLSGFLGPHWRPSAVCFAHPAPRDTAGHRRLFGPSVEFDRDFNGIVFYAEDLDAPNAMADAQLRSYTRRYFEPLAAPREGSEVDRVRDLIEALLPTGRCSIEQIARSLGVDRRTVHRHLARSGETFSSLLHSTRTALAEQFVANPNRSLTEVSTLLGFSSLSAFSRWFHEHFGTGPREWRRSRGGPAVPGGS
ncbi:AraC family transcriptional regulator ligand-binding domain-containing protein [Streptomyces sp. NPDC052301]|uniref:AraC family transcriptional regulator ligand-binding domain-containing protein n=1 Tax=Streptomyces sp. NPDC052301 TaxID=3365687 RepID=UPI0037D8C3F8